MTTVRELYKQITHGGPSVREPRGEVTGTFPTRLSLRDRIRHAHHWFERKTGLLFGIYVNRRDPEDYIFSLRIGTGAGLVAFEIGVLGSTFYADYSKEYRR